MSLRRAFAGAALGAIIGLSLPTGAPAAPTVTFKAQAVPIPHFRHTGNILGAGAAVQLEWTIKGTEYGGFPAPLIGINTYLPAGTRIHPQGFVPCSPTGLKDIGATACPAKSKITLSGKANGVVSFGRERVEEGMELGPHPGRAKRPVGLVRDAERAFVAAFPRRRIPRTP